MPAKELHVCGDPACLPLLQKLCKASGDSLEVRTYDRLSSLKVGTKALGSLVNAKAGDCIVSFSRKDVHTIRGTIESMGQHKCAVVYGSLPPESRHAQAALFNAKRTGINILSSSDAIGLGLNLNIKRILFSSLRKYDGIEERQLWPFEMKQIAGRAGRYTKHGVVTTLHSQDMPVLRHGMDELPQCLDTACVFPGVEHIEACAGELPVQSTGNNFCAALDAFVARMQLDPTTFFLANFDDIRTNALMLRNLSLSIREAYTFSVSPSDPGDPTVSMALVEFASIFAQKQQVDASCLSLSPQQLHVAHSEVGLQHLESHYKVLDLYVWLSYRFEAYFPAKEEVMLRRAHCSDLINISIKSMTLVNKVI